MVYQLDIKSINSGLYSFIRDSKISYQVLWIAKKKEKVPYHGKVPKMYNVPAHQFVLVIFSNA